MTAFICVFVFINSRVLIQTDFLEHAGNESPVHFCCFSKVVEKLLVPWVYMKALEPFSLELKSKIKKILFIIWSRMDVDISCE